MRTRSALLLTIVAILGSLADVSSATAHNILDFGAIPDDDSLSAEQTNAQAFMDAIVAANYTTDGSSREVLIPAGYNFNMLAVWAQDFTNMTISIEGNITASKRHHKWETREKKKHGEIMNVIRNFMDFKYVHDVVVRGHGQVDGQGYMWWIREYIQRNPYGRPKLLNMNHCTNIEVTGVRWLNSPYYFIQIDDVDGLYVHDFEIMTEMKGQLELGKLLAGSSSGYKGLNGMTLPTYPLNTDGVDPAGKNILIERLNITNHDDAVAVKPMNKKGLYAQCSENIIVRDCNITFGVGMTIGSVPAEDNYNCVRNVQFLNHKFYHPYKAIYVKTNPGLTTSMLPGSGGQITNILYDNIEIHNPIWWSIYIGPQQQKQPGGDGPGCMLYPLGGCETQPRIDVHDITLRNIRQYGTILPLPGIIRCNETNPCTNFVFQNVKSHGIWTLLGFNYITENVQGVVTESRPVPAFGGNQSVLGDNASESLVQGYISAWIKNVFEEILKLGDIKDILVMTQRSAHGALETFKMVQDTLQIAKKFLGY